MAFQSTALPVRSLESTRMNRDTEVIYRTVLMLSLGFGSCDYRDVACDVECDGRAMEGLRSAETKHINIKTKRTKRT